MDTAQRIADLLAAMPGAVLLMDSSGRVLSKTGQIAGVMGDVIPSRDPLQASRWRFLDRGGATIGHKDWPGARSLRGVVDHAGMTGRYSNEGQHPVKVVSIPVASPANDVAVVSFLRKIDASRRSAEGSHDDLDHRFIDTLARAVAA